MSEVDVLIPTCDRPAALAVTLATLVGQTFRDFRVVVSDQTEEASAFSEGEPAAVARVLRAVDVPFEAHRHLPRRGVAENRAFLLSLSDARYALFVDDDVVFEPDVMERLVETIRRERCGFVGQAVIGLSHVEDVRPHEQHVEFWDGPVTPEHVEPGGEAWGRHRLHNAANLQHVQTRMGITAEDPRTYRVAWVGGCVLYDREKLESVGGFSFWRELPAEHAGEDVLAQLRVMERYGGCGVMPSGVYHQELPTTVPVREIDAPHALHRSASRPVSSEPAS